MANDDQIDYKSELALLLARNYNGSDSGIIGALLSKAGGNAEKMHSNNVQLGSYREDPNMYSIDIIGSERELNALGARKLLSLEGFELETDPSKQPRDHNGNLVNGIAFKISKTAFDDHINDLNSKISNECLNAMKGSNIFNSKEALLSHCPDSPLTQRLKRQEPLENALKDALGR